MPAYVVTLSMKQLRDKMGAFLTDHRSDLEKIEMFSTPRRFRGAWLAWRTSVRSGQKI